MYAYMVKNELEIRVYVSLREKIGWVRKHEVSSPTHVSKLRF